MRKLRHESLSVVLDVGARREMAGAELVMLRALVVVDVVEVRWLRGRMRWARRAARQD